MCSLETAGRGSVTIMDEKLTFNVAEDSKGPTMVTGIIMSVHRAQRSRKVSLKSKCRKTGTVKAYEVLNQSGWGNCTVLYSFLLPDLSGTNTLSITHIRDILN